MVESGCTFANAIANFPGYDGTSKFCGCPNAATDGYNCAHLVSKALDNAGFSIKNAHDTINARCANKLPIRAVDVRNWVAANTACTKHDSHKKGKSTFFYCKGSNGQEHCGFIDGDGNVKDTGYGV